MLNLYDQNPHPIEDTAVAFREDGGNTNPPDLIFIPQPENGDRYPIRLLAIGIPPGVNSVIHQLHVKQFAEVAAWSPAMKSRYPGEIMKVMTQYFVMK